MALTEPSPAPDPSDPASESEPVAHGTANGGELSATEFNAAVQAVTSAFGDPTRREIYLHIRSHGSATANTIAETFDLHPNVARHHLEKLAAGGYLEVELVRSPGGAGRPSKHYAARPSDLSLAFPPRRDDLLGTLLARALERLDPADAAEMAESVGFDYGRMLAARMTPTADARTRGARTVKAAVAVVADALTAHGFAAHSESSGRTLTLVSQHCPFGEAAQRWPDVMCAVDRGMIRGMLLELYGTDTPVTLQASRPAGDDYCVTRV